jgi:hypothetical protein
MDKIVENINTLFDKIYSAFIMRDIAGKIIPGLILITPVLLFFSKNPKNIFNLLINFNFMIWLLILIFLWIVGYAVQSFG